MRPPKTKCFCIVALLFKTPKVNKSVSGRNHPLCRISRTCATQLRRHNLLNTLRIAHVGSSTSFPCNVNLFYRPYRPRVRQCRDFKCLGLSSFVSFYYIHHRQIPHSASRLACHQYVNVANAPQTSELLRRGNCWPCLRVFRACRSCADVSSGHPLSASPDGVERSCSTVVRRDGRR